MMSNEKLHNNQIGLRIRTARKKKVSTRQSLQIY